MPAIFCGYTALRRVLGCVMSASAGSRLSRPPVCIIDRSNCVESQEKEAKKFEEKGKIFDL
jgi:hypothetical protein